MADGTGIEWCDATWNVITGCRIKSPGCAHCWAMTTAGTRLQNHPSRIGLTRPTKNGPVWNGDVRFNEQWLDQPLRWRKPRAIFVCGNSDLFYEAVPRLWQNRVFARVVVADHHLMLVLTKRPEAMCGYARTCLDSVRQVAHAEHLLGIDATFQDRGIDWPPQHIWLGVSIERQQEADERRYHLERLARAGWNTWLSYEPALGPIDWTGWEFVKWIVSGGESGKHARYHDPRWHYATRDWCAAHHVMYHFKQWGRWAPVYADPPDRPGIHFAVRPDGRADMVPHGARYPAELEGRAHMDMPRP